MSNFDIMDKIINLPGIMIALIAIPYGEALMTHLMGDDTAKNMGRLTISPKAHLDPFGFLMIFLVGFGWAKPITINERNFKNKQLGIILFFLSGTIMNLIVAVLFGWIIILFKKINFGSMELYFVLSRIITITLSLGAFRLLPLPPLAGFYLLLEILPYEISMKLRELERFSMIIIIVLLATNLLMFLVMPIYKLLFTIFDILTLGLF